MRTIVLSTLAALVLLGCKNNAKQTEEKTTGVTTASAAGHIADAWVYISFAVREASKKTTKKQNVQLQH